MGFKTSLLWRLAGRRGVMAHLQTRLATFKDMPKEERVEQVAIIFDIERSQLRYHPVTFVAVFHAFRILLGDTRNF
jgi:hypothetical protein